MARKRGMQFIPYDYEAAYNKAMEDMHEWFIENLFQHRKKVIYALKEITTGDQFEIEIYPQFRSMDEVPPEGRTIKKDNNKAQKNLNDKNARKYVERLINENFSDRDIWMTLTYDGEHLPPDGDVDAAIKNVQKYIRLDAREFGLPQARERVFTVSVLNGERFEFDDLIRTPMRNLQEFLEDDASVPDVYDVTQPSVLACIGEKGIRRATVITDCAYTITTRQDRTPAQVIDRGGGRYRYLTERECWRLMGYTDEDFDRAKAVQERNGKYYKALYDQAGNSIAVPIFESIFRKIILHEVA